MRMRLMIVMALVTYTLLSALASGLQSRFHPEVLGYSLSKAMLVVIGEFCAIKLGCYLLDVRGSGASGVELIGYGGYKFVGYVLNSPFPSLIFFMSICIAEAIDGTRLTYRIIFTVLTGFLNVGRLTSITVFIYVLLANAFFLVSRPFLHFRLLSP
jgi:hypothetical protein